MNHSRTYPEDKEPFSVLKNSVFEKKSMLLKWEGPNEFPVGPLRTELPTFHTMQKGDGEPGARGSGWLGFHPSYDPYPKPKPILKIESINVKI